MIHFKKYLTFLPESYFVIFAILLALDPPLSIQPSALVLLAAFTLQLIFRNNVSGMIIGVIFFLLNLYMVFALADEVADFPSFNFEAKRLLFTGLAIIGLNLYMSTKLVSKNLPRTKPNPTSSTQI